jgi:signal transduction histidine kinase
MLNARMRGFLEGRPDAPLLATLVGSWARLEIGRLDEEGGGAVSADELPLAQALDAGRPVRQKLTLRQRGAGRDFHFDVIAAPIYAAAPDAGAGGEQRDLRGAVAVWRDITEAVEFERIQEEFVRVAAHELKTPVAIVRAHAQALLRRSDAAGASRARVESIVRGADRIARLTDDLLDIMQLHAGQVALNLEIIRLSDLLDPILEDAGRRAPTHHVGLAGDAEISLRLDRARVAQVVRCLISNAIKYSPGGGEVTVRVARWQREAVISITDQGVGIPAAKQPRMFERFYRPHSGTAHDYGGMGVGLYIAREIVRLHGGRIWFESREGAGSTFSFSLPLLGEERDDGP